jgi:UDPglucose--hexose-1-phosphate uridylyltransferase
MSQLRQNPATKEWVIVATERARRPEDFPVPRRPRVTEPFEKSCPFCPGNEGLTPPEIIAYRGEESAANGPGWRVRVVPNRFAALGPEGTPERRGEAGFFRSMDGLGAHEVIIESPTHNLSLATMEPRQVEEVVLACRERYLALARDPRIQLVIVFKNHGRGAGTSLEHPHSQIVATPIVPTRVRYWLEEAMRYYDDNGRCVYCDVIKEERADRSRIVLETNEYIVLEPFAARTPFDTWIMPKSHAASFGSISVEEAKSLSAVISAVMRKIHQGLGDPDYNFYIDTAPRKDADEDYYHWHLHLTPRLTTPAGFEMGSGVYINTSVPEECARFLRDVPV